MNVNDVVLALMKAGRQEPYWPVKMWKSRFIGNIARLIGKNYAIFINIED